jgi:hypothetical protein
VGNGGQGGHDAVFVPVRATLLILGKNLPIFAALLVINVVFLALLCAVARQWELYLPIIGWTSLALVVLVSVGNLVSIWFPFRAVTRGWKVQQQSTNKGCAYGLLYLAVTAASSTLLAPVFAAFFVPVVWVGAGWLALSVPLAVAYAAGAYLLSLRLAVPLLVQRELTLIEKLTRSDEP